MISQGEGIKLMSYPKNVAYVFQPLPQGVLDTFLDQSNYITMQ